MAHQSVYIARTLTETAMATLDRSEHELRVGGEAPPSREDLLTQSSGAAGVVVTLSERIDAEFFDAAGPNLKIVANVAVGFDNIDVNEAKRRGVIVTNTPGVLDEATADHTFAMILNLCRRVSEADHFVRSGTPWVWSPRMLVGLDISAGATLGIIGFGRIGKAVARRAEAFNMRVIAFEAQRTPGDVDGTVSFVGFEDILTQSDVISLHLPLLPSTRHIIDAAVLARMKPTAYLINAARGGVVDEAALIAALNSGTIRGAAIDTFENEPFVNPALLATDNLLLTPHIASAGDRTRDRMCLLALKNVDEVLAGREPVTQVVLR